MIHSATSSATEHTPCMQRILIIDGKFARAHMQLGALEKCSGFLLSLLESAAHTQNDATPSLDYSPARGALTTPTK